MSPAPLVLALAAALLPVAASEAEGCASDSCKTPGVVLMQQRPGALSPARRGSLHHGHAVAPALIQEKLERWGHDSVDKRRHRNKLAQEASQPEESAEEPEDPTKNYDYDYNPREKGSAEQLPEAHAQSKIERLAGNVTNDRDKVEAAIAKLKAAQAKVEKEKAEDAAEEKAAKKAAKEAAERRKHEAMNHFAPEKSVPGTNAHHASHKTLVIIAGIAGGVLFLACCIAAACHMSSKPRYEDSDSDEEYASPAAKKLTSNSRAPPSPAPARKGGEEAEAKKRAEQEEAAAAKKRAEEEAAKKIAEQEAAKKLAEQEAAKKLAEEEAAKKLAEEEAAKKRAEEEAAKAEAELPVEKDD